MNTSNALAFILKNVRTVVINFQGYQNDYSYLTCDQSIKVGDAVVVEHTPKSKPELTRLSVAVVVNTYEFPNLDLNLGITYKWVIQKINFDDYSQKRDREELLHTMMQNAARRKVSEAVLGEVAETLSAAEFESFKASL